MMFFEPSLRLRGHETMLDYVTIADNLRHHDIEPPARSSQRPRPPSPSTALHKAPAYRLAATLGAVSPSRAQRAAQAVTANERTARDLPSQRRIGVTVGLGLCVRRDGNGQRANRQVRAHELERLFAGVSSVEIRCADIEDPHQAAANLGG